ncbi:hypothetical protein OWR29_38060 [Actinoplanes sp. Pm04-4]|uniref:Uncharacterized protein n=1 Tax=Paractinoplanes pyxinae TaxID=2997416 RepID=A0ABT4BBI1_9ACTN|nr:hypothetical protein [Actinoplanes pyxinae]MCY1143837.1 hypothetical protein [Actinoplanes pyxinae]
MTYPDLEKPDGDAAEQLAEAFPGDEDRAPNPPELSVETPEWDAQEQSQIVRDDDEYR